MNVSETKRVIHDDECGHEDAGEDDNRYRQCVIGYLCSWRSQDVRHGGYDQVRRGLVMYQVC